MTDIKPIVIEGEPWCALDGCPSHVYADAQHLCEVLKAPVPQDFNGYQYCIPALRQQRDEAMRDRIVESCGWLGGLSADESRRVRKARAADIYGPAAAARLFPDKETR